MERKIVINRLIRYFPVIVFFTFVIVVFTTYYYKSKAEFGRTIGFVVTKVQTAKNDAVTLYGTSGKMPVFNYRLSSFYKIRAGDSIHKDKFGKFLRIYKKDGSGNYRLHDSVYPNGGYGHLWEYKN